MNRVSALTHNAPGLMGPPDEPPSLYDDVENVRQALADAEIPDYLACALADVAMADWSLDAWMQALRDVRRHVQPILARAGG